MNANDEIFNPGSSQFIGTTVPFNPFGDFRVPIASNQETVAFATAKPKDEDTSKLWTIDGSIYTTSLFDLPAGGVGMAIGGQFRRETLKENPDPLNVAGDIAGNSPVPTASGGRKSFAFYIEADIPVFSPKMAITGFHSLEITAAGSLMVLLMGCGHKEDPPPANYYTGPMTPKSSGNPITQKTGPSTDAK